MADCLSGNKTVNITVNLETVSVAYSLMGNVSDGTSDNVNMSNNPSRYKGHDLNEDKVRECRLQVTSNAKKKRFLYVHFVKQTCTPKSKVFLLGKYTDFHGKKAT